MNLLKSFNGGIGKNMRKDSRPSGDKGFAAPQGLPPLGRQGLCGSTIMVMVFVK